MLVDDEEIILNELCTIVEQNRDARVCGAFTEPEKALAAIERLKPDVAFLDIEMPEISGIEMAKRIGEMDADIYIIFVTAYEQYAMSAFDVSAVHYLLKPIAEEKMDEAIQRIKKLKQKNQAEQIAAEPEFIKNAMGALDRINVKNRDNIYIVKTNDILYIKSENGKTNIVTKKGSFSTRIGLQYWESNLKGTNLIRCHRSFIVNADYISKMVSIMGEYKELELEHCDAYIPIGRQNLSNVKDWLKIT